MNGQVENLDFLRSFAGIRSFYCLTASLKNIGGLAHCVNLTHLHLGTTFSSQPDLQVLGHLSRLEAVTLAGPNPSKGLETMGALPSVKSLGLYAPKWSLEHLPAVFPAVEDLSISQGAYRSLDFIANLNTLIALDIAYARKLTAFDAVGRHRHLRTLRIGHAITGLRSCSQFGSSPTVEQIRISACKQLDEIAALADWPALREAEIYDCPLIRPVQVERLRRSGKNVNGE